MDECDNCTFEHPNLGVPPNQQPTIPNSLSAAIAAILDQQDFKMAIVAATTAPAPRYITNNNNNRNNNNNINNINQLMQEPTIYKNNNVYNNFNNNNYNTNTFNNYINASTYNNINNNSTAAATDAFIKYLKSHQNYNTNVNNNLNTYKMYKHF